MPGLLARIYPSAVWWWPQIASGMDLALEVAARLKQVLSSMNPIYHEVFISMYKILVPIYFSVPSLYGFMCVMECL